MIKAKSKDGTLFFGIDKENVKRLQEGKPIYIRGRDLGIAHDIFIMYGETLDDVAKEFGIPKVN